MLVFREGRRTVSASGLVEAFVRDLRAPAGRSSRDHLISLFLRAGEVECALADGGLASPVPALLADLVADAAVQGRAMADPEMHVKDLLRLPLPAEVPVSVPEGFAYYALHPLDYAAIANDLPASDAPVMVVGIRSIGTTLSAVVAAAARQQGRPAQRWTVRPGGHPWNRSCEFTSQQTSCIRQAAARTEFLVVDEGPGLSGSSLLSVAEALESAGAARERIAIVCAHQPDPQRLCASRAHERWARFRVVAAGSSQHRPPDARDWMGAGEWRRTLLDCPLENWPSSWTAMERSKYLARDGACLFKFEGHGRFGEAVLERAEALHRAGFAPHAAPAGDGFVACDLLPGKALRACDLDRAVLGRLAEYCAWRAAAFRSERTPTPLDELVRVNASEEFGIEAAAEAPCAERVVIADGRMQPHEWRCTPAGEILKTDAADHGDDHFYPGPTDIAWDLAGAIVEWQMDSGAVDYFLARYAALSGDRPQPRLPAYRNAYALFRLGYCRMAADALAGSDEEPRLRRDHACYRAVAQSLCAGTVAA